MQKSCLFYHVICIDLLQSWVLQYTFLSVCWLLGLKLGLYLHITPGMYTAVSANHWYNCCWSIRKFAISNVVPIEFESCAGQFKFTYFNFTFFCLVFDSCLNLFCKIAMVVKSIVIFCCLSILLLLFICYI